MWVHRLPRLDDKLVGPLVVKTGLALGHGTRRENLAREPAVRIKAIATAHGFGVEVAFTASLPQDRSVLDAEVDLEPCLTPHRLT